VCLSSFCRMGNGQRRQWATAQQSSSLSLSDNDTDSKEHLSLFPAVFAGLLDTLRESKATSSNLVGTTESSGTVGVGLYLNDAATCCQYKAIKLDV
jgi:hypothetical protein